MTDTAAKALVRNFFAAADAVTAGAPWPSRDALWTESFVVHLNEALGGGAVGLGAYQRSVEAFVTGFPNSRHEFLDQVAAGDVVASRIVWTGTHAGTFLGVPATARAVTVQVMNFVRVQDGRLAEIWPQFDWQSLHRQIG